MAITAKLLFKADGAAQVKREAEKVSGSVSKADSDVKKHASHISATLKSAMAFAGVASGAAFVKGAVEGALKEQGAAQRLTDSLTKVGAGGQVEKIRKQLENMVPHAAGANFEQLAAGEAQFADQLKSATLASQANQAAVGLSIKKGISYNDAVNIIATAENGRTKALRRAGVVLTEVHTAQDALRSTGQKYTVEQMRAAKAADLLATKNQILTATLKFTAGAHESTAQKIAQVKAEFQDMQAKVGMALLPVLIALIPPLTNLAQWLGKVLPPIIRSITKDVKDVVKWFKAHKTISHDLVAVLKVLGPALVALLVARKLVSPFMDAYRAVKSFYGAAKTAWGIAGKLAGKLGLLDQSASNTGGFLSALGGKFAGLKGKIGASLPYLLRVAGLIAGIASAAISAQAAMAQLFGNINDPSSKANPAGVISKHQRQAGGQGGAPDLVGSFDFSHGYTPPGWVTSLFGSKGGMVPSYLARGGGPRGSDTIPAWLTPGEFIMNRRATAANRQFLEGLNNGMSTSTGGPEIIELHHTSRMNSRVVAEEVTRHVLKRNARGNTSLVGGGLVTGVSRV